MSTPFFWPGEADDMETRNALLGQLVFSTADMTIYPFGAVDWAL